MSIIGLVTGIGFFQDSLSWDYNEAAEEVVKIIIEKIHKGNLLEETEKNL